MISLLISIAVLIAGYFIYGRFTEKIFSPDDRLTPAVASPDGVDRVPIKRWRAFMIQLLNIAGTGPIFGALMGALFGPIVFLWIVLGSILGGAVHDYMSGMISSRHDGESIAELSGEYIGKPMKLVMRIFSLLLLFLVGTVFVTSPAALLANLTPESMGATFWTVVILVYYTIATILPIDKVIGKLYPIFGAVLIFMAIGIFCGISFGDYVIPEISLSNLHPSNLPVWPFMFITVACGAISGFHATQSPMVAKCITSEKEGRSVFYGAMISEAVIALVWAAAGVAFYGTTDILSSALASLGQSGVVYEISTGLLGGLGGVLAIVGVVACPITSGDTAFRGARLIIAEWTKSDQSKIVNRLIISIPMLVLAAFMTMIDFNVLWRYFSWSNQTLAMITLWVVTAYLLKMAKKPIYSLISALPAAFMSAVSATYILMADEGFKISDSIAYPIGYAFTGILFAVYLVLLIKRCKKAKDGTSLS